MSIVEPKPQQALSIRDRLSNPKMVAEIGKALPKHVTPERMARVALTAITRTPQLAECDQASFFRCLLDLSQWGLEPDGRRAHLIPFRNNKRGVIECQLIIDYKGLVELAYRSGIVKAIHADVVREGDLFRFSMGEVQEHTPHFLRRDELRPDSEGEVYAAYCRVSLEGGATKTEVLSRKEIESIRKRSKAGGAGPWVTDWAEMAKKGLALDTPIPTPDGWTTMGEIQVGDTVFDMDGKPTSVLAVSKIKHLTCFRITLHNGESIVCDDEHRWCATIGKSGSRTRKNGWPVHTVNECYEAKQRGEIVSLPVAGELDTPEVELPVDPWILGYWLGNGSRSAGNVTCHRDDAAYLKERIAMYCPVGAIRNDKRSDATCISIKTLKGQLREAGVLNAKRVPEIYMRASRSQRLSLLQGLMDSDGHIDKQRGRAHFYSTDQALASAVAELATSLGNKVHESCKEMTGYGKVVKAFYVGWLPVQPCVTTPRKLANYRERKIAPYCGVRSIEKIESVPTRCIAVDAPTRTYLCGRGMVPTHNTAFRRVSKWLPLSAEIRDAIERDDDKFDPVQLAPKTVITASELSSMLAEAPAINDQSDAVDDDREPGEEG